LFIDFCDSALPQPIQWLWPSWIPYGKLTILAGEFGVGKSTLALNIAALLASHATWPDHPDYTGAPPSTLENAPNSAKSA